MELQKFTTQSFAVHAINVCGQAFLAWIFSKQLGAYWYWIMPLFLLVGLPRAKRLSVVEIDDEEIREGGKTVLQWNQVSTLAKRGWTRAVFAMRNGKKKSISTFHWPVEHTESFYELLSAKGFTKNLEQK